jgi:hypothetical protein
VSGQVDELARHVRRLGNHELNELLLELPKPRFAALAEVALARPVLPAGLVLRFEPASGVDGWTVVACAPRRRLGILTRDRDPSGRLVYRAWTRAGDPVQLTGVCWWRRRGDAAAALAWVTPVSAARCLALAAYVRALPEAALQELLAGLPRERFDRLVRRPTGPRGRPHDRGQALPALRPAQVGRRILPAPPGPAAVLVLPTLHPRRHPPGPSPPPPGPRCG